MIVILTITESINNKCFHLIFFKFYCTVLYNLVIPRTHSLVRYYGREKEVTDPDLVACNYNARYMNPKF